jgi:sulfatase modifying factor 1
VEGGSFYRGETTDCPVTVGRMRAFVADRDRWISEAGGSHPQVGECEHVPGYGSGWQTSWQPGGQLPVNSAALTDASHLGEHLFCGSEGTWRDTPGTEAEENLPINCINWYEAFAFCIWDGGRLATEAEWEYAAAGGALKRTYPWGDSPEPDDDHAVYGCQEGLDPECPLTDLHPVGSKPAGAGYFGQLDLAGSMDEWGFDWLDPGPEYINPCSDCADLTFEDPIYSFRVARGGDWKHEAFALSVTHRDGLYPERRSSTIGVRCVRTAP